MIHARVLVPILLAALGATPSAARAQKPNSPKVEEIPKGRWSREKVPEGWDLHHTANYQIQSQAGLEKAKRLANHLESMMLLYKKMFPPDKQFDRFPVKLFKDRKAFLDYGAPPSAAAYYSQFHRELVAYDTGKWSDDQDAPEAPITGKEGSPESKESGEEIIAKLRKRYEMDILGVIAHEAWHQFFHHHIVSFVDMPSWIDEGMGDYFYTARPVRKNGVLVQAELGAINDIRLPAIQHAIKKGDAAQIKQLLRMRQQEYYGNPGVYYAQGWSLCQFLLHSGNKRYREVIPTLIRVFKSNHKMNEATKAAFSGIDLEKLEEEWKAYVLGLKIGR